MENRHAGIGRKPAYPAPPRDILRFAVPTGRRQRCAALPVPADIGRVEKSAVWSGLPKQHYGEKRGALHQDARQQSIPPLATARAWFPIQLALDSVNCPQLGRLQILQTPGIPDAGRRETRRPTPDPASGESIMAHSKVYADLCGHRWQPNSRHAPGEPKVCPRSKSSC